MTEEPTRYVTDRHRNVVCPFCELEVAEHMVLGKSDLNCSSTDSSSRDGLVICRACVVFAKREFVRRAFERSLEGTSEVYRQWARRADRPEIRNGKRKTPSGPWVPETFGASDIGDPYPESAAMAFLLVIYPNSPSKAVKIFEAVVAEYHLNRHHPHQMAQALNETMAVMDSPPAGKSWTMLGAMLGAGAFAGLAYLALRGQK